MNKRIRKKIAKRRLESLPGKVLEEILEEMAREMGTTVAAVKNMRSKGPNLHDTGYVYAPYVPLHTTKLEDAVEEVVSEEVLEVLPPSDDVGIQVGDGEGPAVLVPRKVEIKPKMREFDTSGIMSRYGQAMADKGLYKQILISTT